jgi:hypothetical protein
MTTENPMKTIAVTLKEGGEWHPFPLDRQIVSDAAPNGPAVHAIKFENGDIWDAMSGWRHKPHWKFTTGEPA